MRRRQRSESENSDEIRARYNRRLLNTVPFRDHATGEWRALNRNEPFTGPQYGPNMQPEYTDQGWYWPEGNPYIAPRPTARLARGTQDEPIDVDAEHYDRLRQRQFEQWTAIQQQEYAEYLGIRRNDNRREHNTAWVENRDGALTDDV